MAKRDGKIVQTKLGLSMLETDAARLRILDMSGFHLIEIVIGKTIYCDTAFEGMLLSIVAFSILIGT